MYAIHFKLHIQPYAEYIKESRLSFADEVISVFRTHLPVFLLISLEIEKIHVYTFINFNYC